VVPSGGTPGGGGFVSPPPGFGVFVVARNFKQDEARSWNVSVERQITHDMVIRAAYVGTYGYNLYHDYQLNQCDPPSVVATTPYPQCLPFYSLNSNITTVDFRNSSGLSQYNAFQTQLRKTTGIGLTFTASYTYSVMRDNIDNPIDPYITTLNLVGAGWHTSNYPQNFVLSYTYDLPFGSGKRYLSGASPAARALLGNWSVNGITTIRSGGALLVTENGSLLPPQADTGNAPANYTSGCGSNPHTLTEWFNINCFSAPAVNTYGDGAVGNIYGPGFMNWDFSVSKTGSVKERLRFKVEADIFNLFNRSNLNNPNTGCQQTTPGAVCTSAGGFGTITGDNGLPREVQLGVKILF